MVSIAPTASLRDVQAAVREIYGLPNDRTYDLGDMLANIQRFAMRGLKGIRKGDHAKITLNLLIALSWFLSTLNRLHIDLEDAVWARFPYVCSYCGRAPCRCKKEKVSGRQKIAADHQKRPLTLSAFQQMFEAVYPASGRTLEHAGVHLAEEMGEFAEALLAYRGRHHQDDFRHVVAEAADLFSCIIGIFNSLGQDMATALAERFADNCHVCHQAPCVCSFDFVVAFKS